MDTLDIFVVIATLMTLAIFALAVLISGFIAKLLYIIYLSSEKDGPVAATPTANGNQPPPTIKLNPNADPYEDEEDLLRLLFAPDENISIWVVDIAHMVSGFLLVAVIGCFSLFYYFAMNPMGYGARFGFRTGVRRGSGGDNFSSVILVFIMVVGTLRALWAIYKGVKYFSKRGLEIVETRILDVNEAEGDVQVPQQEQQQQQHQPEQQPLMQVNL
jgi:hypothetical protein